MSDPSFRPEPFPSDDELMARSVAGDRHAFAPRGPLIQPFGTAVRLYGRPRWKRP